MPRGSTFAPGSARGDEQCRADDGEAGGGGPAAGRSFAGGTRRLNSPAKAGPLPSATTVPIATPVESTAAKKQSW